MSLSVILGAAKLAMDVGPAAIRGISSLFGGSETADKVADMVEQVDGALGSSKAEKQNALVNQLKQLPPESLVELERVKLEMEKEMTRRQELVLQDEQHSHKETQLTIRNGDNAEDEYVRHTRPWGCRLGLYSAIAYVFIFDLLEVFAEGTGADWQIAAGLMAPFLTYLGWRTADKRGMTKGTGSMLGDAAKAVKFRGN